MVLLASFFSVKEVWYKRKKGKTGSKNKGYIPSLPLRKRDARKRQKERAAEETCY